MLYILYIIKVYGGIIPIYNVLSGQECKKIQILMSTNFRIVSNPLYMYFQMGVYICVRIRTFRFIVELLSEFLSRHNMSGIYFCVRCMIVYIFECIHLCTMYVFVYVKY